jgi:omega-amidase
MPTLSITLIQSNLFWENPGANLEMFTDKINAITEKTEIVVLPEMFTTGFSMDPENFAEDMNGPTLRWMKTIAAEKKIILTGSVMIRENGRYFNRMIWMQPDGKFGFYDKRHLFSYAGEELHYTPGNKKLIVSVKGWKILLQVCYDLRFPVWARQSADRDNQYDAIINVANWPQKRSAAWKTLLAARAIENQCFVVGVNRVGLDKNDIEYSGDSTIIGPLGEVICQHAVQEVTATYVLQKETITKTREHFPFLKDADRFIIEP